MFEITRALPDEVDCIEGVIGISAKGALQEIPAVVTEKENGELQVGQYILPLSDRSYHRPVSDGFFFHRPLSDGRYLPSSSVRWKLHSIVHCQMEVTFHLPSSIFHLPSSSSETIHEKVKQNHLIDEQNSITCFRIKIFAQFFQISAI